SFTRNHLLKRARFQASWSRPYQLTPKPLTPSNRRTVSLTVTTRIRDVQAAFSATPPSHFRKPVERIARGFAVWADHARSDSALSPAHGRHRPLLQHDLDLGPTRLDHNDASAGPGDLRGESAGLPRQRDHPPSRDRSHRQTWSLTDEAALCRGLS